MSERTFDNFDQYASQYRKIHSQNVKLTGADSFYFASHKAALIENFEKDAAMRILDVGCGDGLVDVFLEKTFPSFSINAIDVSADSIALAKEKQLHNTVFSQFDGLHIPFDDNSFDLILLASVLHHINFELHDSFISEVIRVLKPGGRIYVFEHNPKNPFTRHIVRTCVFDKDARLLRASYAQQLLKENGCSNLLCHFILFFPRMKWLKPLHRLERHLSSLPYGAQYMIRAVK